MEQKTQKKHDLRWVYALIGCLLVIAAVVMILLYFMNGQTSSVEGGGTTETMQSLSCEGTGVEYPFFKHDDADARKIKVNATFDNDKLDTILFMYQLLYNDKNMDEQVLKRIKDANSGDVMMDMHDSGLSTDSFDMRFTALEDGIQMSLYAQSRELSNVSSKFFMLDSASGHYKIDAVKKVYEGVGLKCVENK